MQNHICIFSLLFLNHLFSEPSETNWRLHSAQDHTETKEKAPPTLQDNNLQDIIAYGDTDRKRKLSDSIWQENRFRYWNIDN